VLTSIVFGPSQPIADANKMAKTIRLNPEDSVLIIST
jgi:hypothetical protein